MNTLLGISETSFSSPLMIGLAVIIIVVLAVFFWITRLRRVVAPNEVHIVRRGSKTEVYGNVDEQEASNGNVYYEFPATIPVLGVDVSVLPLSVFDVDLNNYEAYDVDRLPFVVDIKAFFRIADYKVAASRILTFDELQAQLTSIVQGAVRSILAKEDLESIMSERSKYGEDFTTEVGGQLKHWGVEPVKNIELMDIRDARGEEVIANIMMKKKSLIEKESRTTVAQNNQAAQEAEILAQQEVDLKQQDAEKAVGLRKADVAKEVGIAQEESAQAVQEKAKVTAEKEMEVKRVKETQEAEIKKSVATTNAEAEKQVTITKAEAAKQAKDLNSQADLIVMQNEAEGQLVKAKKSAEGIQAEGEAKALVETKMRMAPVDAQLKLASEIGSNKEYQTYLISIRQIEAIQIIGIEQAKNLGCADIKIIAGAGSVSDGANKAAGIFSPNSGFNLAGMLETFGSTEIGKQILDKLGAKTVD